MKIDSNVGWEDRQRRRTRRYKRPQGQAQSVQEPQVFKWNQQRRKGRVENFCKAEASETTGEKGRPEEVDRTGEEVLLLGTTKTHTQREREREGRAGTGDLWFHRYQMERTLRRHLPGHCHVVDVGSAGRCTRQDRIPVPQRYAQLNAFP